MLGIVPDMMGCAGCCSMAINAFDAYRADGPRALLSLAIIRTRFPGGGWIDQVGRAATRCAVHAGHGCFKRSIPPEMRSDIRSGLFESAMAEL